MDSHDAAMSRAISGQVSMTRARILLYFCRLIIIESSLCSHMSLYYSLSERLNHDCRISLKRSTALNYARALIRDLLDRDPPNQRVIFSMI